MAIEPTDLGLLASYLHGSLIDKMKNEKTPPTEFTKEVLNFIK